MWSYQLEVGFDEVLQFCRYFLWSDVDRNHSQAGRTIHSQTQRLDKSCHIAQLEPDVNTMETKAMNRW